MSTFDNVSVAKTANVYFDGKVTSRTITFADGTRKTLGVLLAGEYQFDTQMKELMEITSGSVTVLLPNENEWKTVNAGESFEVPAKAIFQIKCHDVSDYCCSYFEE